MFKLVSTRRSMVLSLPPSVRLSCFRPCLIFAGITRNYPSGAPIEIYIESKHAMSGHCMDDYLTWV